MRSRNELEETWSYHELANAKEQLPYLKSNQEEADTKIILHALDATTNGATQIKIHSPDTDVFILALKERCRLLRISSAHTTLEKIGPTFSSSRIQYGV